MNEDFNTDFDQEPAEKQEPEQKKPKAAAKKTEKLVPVTRRGVTVYRSGKALDQAIADGWTRAD